MAKLTSPLVVYIPDTRGVVLSRYGKGNLKIGPTVYTYSRLPGNSRRNALGTEREGLPIEHLGIDDRQPGTCPGATEECQRICYARRPVQEDGAVARMWEGNAGADVPEIPVDAQRLRIHVSGDFDSVEYIRNWEARLIERPDVEAWAYTRSWRVPALLPALEALRRLPNIQLFASMDKSHADVPPQGWRRAWIDGDPRAGDPQLVKAHMDDPVTHNLTTFDGGRTYVCPEETKRVKDCESCNYCINGDKYDVTFLEH